MLWPPPSGGRPWSGLVYSEFSGASSKSVLGSWFCEYRRARRGPRKQLQLREQLRTERLEPIRKVGKALFHPPETLLVLSESPIDALESFEHFTPDLLQPDHGGRDTC